MFRGLPFCSPRGVIKETVTSLAGNRSVLQRRRSDENYRTFIAKWFYMITSRILVFGFWLADDFSYFQGNFHFFFILCCFVILIIWKQLQCNRTRCFITLRILYSITMVISYVYAKNSAPRADRGFLNDVQNTNSNCDITMCAGIYNFLMHRGVCFDWYYFL